VPLLELRELGFDVTLCAVDIVRERAQTLVHAPLHLRERRCKRLSGATLPLCEIGAMRLTEASFLCGEGRDGLGSLAGQHAADLLGVGCGLLLDGSPELRACARDELVGRGGTGPSAAQRKPRHTGRNQSRSEAPDENPDDHAVTLEATPAAP